MSSDARFRRDSVAASLRQGLAAVALAGLGLAPQPLLAERYHYDAPGRLTLVIYDDLSSIGYSYDPNGNLTAVDVTAAGPPGDADLDGDVDAADLAIILQITLDGGAPYVPTADCTLDDVVDVLDLVCAVGASSPEPTGSPQLALPDLQALRGDQVAAALSLSGVAGVARAVQLDVLFDPAVATPGAPAPGGALADHQVASAVPMPGVLRLVVWSPTNAALATGTLADLPFDVDLAAPLGPSALPLGAGIVAAPDATALLPLGLDPGSIQVYAFEADLSVTKSADPTGLEDGEPIAFTVVAANAGPDPVTGAHVLDPVPGELVAVTWTCTPAGGATCTGAGAANIDDAVDLPVGASATYLILATVAASPGTFANTVTIVAPPDALDGVSANDAATAVVLVYLFADGFETADTSEWSSTVPPP